MRVLPELVGRPVRGWYVRSFPSEHTRRLAAAHPELTYDSDSCNDELPYWTEVDGRRWLVVPYSKVHNDTRYFLAPTYATPRHFAETLIGAADFLLDEARHGAGARLLTVGLHPRWSGQAARATAVRRGSPSCTGSRSLRGGPSTAADRFRSSPPPVTSPGRDPSWL